VTAYQEVETDARGGATMILPAGAESTLAENAASPLPAEPAHSIETMALGQT
jgi:hypothetical protein